MNPKSFQNATLTCGIPEPAASRQKRANSHPAIEEVPTITTRLTPANIPSDSVDARTKTVSKRRLTTR